MQDAAEHPAPRRSWTAVSSVLLADALQPLGWSKASLPGSRQQPRAQNTRAAKWGQKGPFRSLLQQVSQLRRSVCWVTAT